MVKQKHKDVVIGCISGYEFDQVKNWVNSLNRCGFEGDKVMIVYNGSKELVDELEENDIIVPQFHTDDASNGGRIARNVSGMQVAVERFYGMYQFIQNKDYRYVITTDVKDVVFQRNPVDFLITDMGQFDLVVSSEGLQYQSEAWGYQNMLDGFGGDFQRHYATAEIFNVGVLAGRYKHMRSLFRHIYLTANAADYYIADQSAFNILVDDVPWNNVTLRSGPRGQWACQIGTQNDPSKPDLMDHVKRYTGSSPPIMNQEGFVVNNNDIPYHIVHQYERHPGWKQIIDSKYS